MNTGVRAIAVLTAAMSLTSCGLFGGGDDDKLEPAELTKIDTKIIVKRLWSADLGGDAEFLRIALRPVGDGNRIYAASRDGNVMAFQPENGKRLWRRELDMDLSAGPGVGNNLVAVAAADGLIIALDAASGNELWRISIAGESLAPPVIKDDLVVVLTIDNRLRALSAFDGTERWVIEQSAPLLTMRGSSTPVIVGTSVVAGFDNGRLISIDLDSGDIEWEAMLSPPSGRSDLERLADVDGGISVVGQDIYAGGYQGRVAAIASESGQALWTREISSFEGVSADWNNIYTVREDGEILSLTRRTGEESWRQNSLLRREPTVPIPFRTTVVVGDFEGYLHFFSNVDGEPVARLKQGSQAITSSPVVVADRLYVQSDAGSLAAYVIEEPRPSRRRAPDIAEQET